MNNKNHIDIPKEINFIFYHIQKCGGTSIRHMFYNYFIKIYHKKYIFGPEFLGDDTLCFLSDKLNDIQNNKNIDYNNLKVILSHMSYNDIDLSYVPYKITFLRDPVERIISHYYYFDYPNIKIDMFDLSDSFFQDYCSRYGSHMANILGILDEHNKIDNNLLQKRLKEFIFIGKIEYINECIKKLNICLNNIYSKDIVIEKVHHKINENKKTIKDMELLKKRILPYCTNDYILYNSFDKYIYTHIKIDIDKWILEDKKYNIILITGGAGFLGRHLIKKLLENDNNKLICVDNLITGKITNIEEFISNNRFRFINYDITKEFNIIYVNEIYNLASLASPEKYKKYQIETIMVNFLGTKNMLDLAKKHNAKILLTSTSEVYGDPEIHPQPEEYYGNVNTIGERSCYDESKRLAETIMYEYKKIYNLDTKIVRIFNTYGQYMDEKDGRVITNFISKIRNNEPIEIYGDGNQTRSFCYVDDMIDGLIKMMNSNEFGPINLGNPECEFTLNDLVKLFEKILNIKIDIIYLDKTENDPKCRKPIIDKATEKLKWYPKINLEEGLKICMKYLNEN